MKLPTTDLRLPNTIDRLVQQIQALLSRTNQQVNQITEGTNSAYHGARTSVPTTGTWAAGDQVRKSNPVEAGGAGNKYVIVGWVCTVGGTPGTWLEMRTLTGN